MLERRTGDRARAEDLAQEVFLRALESPPLNPKPWLFAVALNLARDEGRRDVRQGRKLELLRGETEHAAAPSPEEALDEAERGADVGLALAQLTEQDRAALLL